jgi:hypothetical protein
MNIIAFFIFITAFIATPSFHANTPTPFFENKIIKSLDAMDVGFGVTVGIDGKTIHDMLWLIDNINIIVRGHKDPITKQLSPKYVYKEQDPATHIFMNAPSTLFDLVHEEELLSPQALAETKEALAKKYTNKNLFEKQWEEVEAIHAQKNNLLQKKIAYVRTDFLNITHIFMQQMHLLEKLVAQLINEWCERSNRQNSFFKKWYMRDKSEDEIVFFHKHMTSPKELILFMGDLKDFLTKLIHSCPRAWAEFLKNKDQYAAHVHTIKKNN